MLEPLQTWSARAPNLPEHGDNPVHTDTGGRKAGYPGAIVAGTTVYALLTHPPAAAWGLDWISRGGAEVRFVDAVLADELVECAVSRLDADDNGADDGWLVEARARGGVRATCQVWPNAEPAAPRDGEPLEPLAVVLDDQWAGYGQRSGDDLAIYDDLGLAHPAAWPCLANRVFATQLITGAWIHVRSRIVHLGTAARGANVVVLSKVVDRFQTRMGKRAVIDAVIEADGIPVCAIEHEAIIEVS